MDFKITSTKSATRRRIGGLGLLDFIVAMAVGSLVLVVMAAAFAFSGRSYAALMNYSELDQQSRITLDRMTKDIRMVRYVYSYGSNWVWFMDYNNTWLGYWWDPYSRTVYRWKNNTLDPMLTGCTNLAFSMRQRTPLGGQYEQYPIATNLQMTCKLLNMNWICTRTVLGTRVNSETVQSARIVMRNQ